MRYLPILCILICLIGITLTADSVTYTLPCNGGWCTVCEPWVPRDVGNYACSNGMGDWCHCGRKVVPNLVPAGNVVIGVVVELHGLWGCCTSNSVVNITLQGHEVQTRSLTGSCLCATCNTDPVFTWTGTTLVGGSFPNYNYNSSAPNLLQINVLSGIICVTDIFVNITYDTPLTSRTPPPITLPSCDDFGGCGPNGTCFVNLTDLTTSCICEQDFYGPNCQCYLPSYKLITDHPPVLDVSRSGFKTKDTLYLVVNNSAKYFDTTITFKNQLNTSCDFPTPSDGVIWTSTFDPIACLYTLQVTIPWGVAWPTCIFNRTDTPEWLIFEGEMIIVNYENPPPLSVSGANYTFTRQIVSNIPFIIRYPKSITVGQIGNVTVYADVNIDAEIIEQTFTTGDSPAPGVGYVQLATLTDYPFKITGPLSLTANPTRSALTVVGDSANGVTTCLDDGSACLQYWDIDIYPFLDQCNLDGSYTFNFSITCQPSVSNCPLVNNTGYIVFVLASEYFCPTIVETVDLTGSLVVYRDSSHLLPENIFIVSQTAYFVLSISSVQASIVGANVTDFYVVLGNGTTVYFFTNGNITPSGTAAELLITDNADPQFDDFIQLNLIPAIFLFDYPTSSNDVFFVAADVFFFNTQKRTVVNLQLLNSTQNSQSQQYSGQTSLTITKNQSGTPTSASTIVVYDLIMGLGGLMCLATQLL